MGWAPARLELRPVFLRLGMYLSAVPRAAVGCSSAPHRCLVRKLPKPGKSLAPAPRPARRTMRSGSAASAAPNPGIPGNANTNTPGIAQSSRARDILSVLRGFFSWVTCAGSRGAQTSPGSLPVICSSSSLCLRKCLGLLFHAGHQFFQTAES